MFGKQAITAKGPIRGPHARRGAYAGSLRHCLCAQLYKEIAKPPEKLNKTRGIGIIKAHADFVASVIADDYETWDDTIKELRVLKSGRDPVTGALVEIIWTRYCLRKTLPPPVAFELAAQL